MDIAEFRIIGRVVFRSSFMDNASKANVMAINDPFMSYTEAAPAFLALSRHVYFVLVWLFYL
jgi:hypothetical protein